jgi:hypothetical protein
LCFKPLDGGTGDKGILEKYPQIENRIPQIYPQQALASIVQLKTVKNAKCLILQRIIGVIGLL